MKTTQILVATAIFATSGLAFSADNCGPGTNDPKCEKNNKEREKSIKKDQDERRDDAAKRDGTYGRIGERKESKDDATNNSARTTSK